MSNGTGIGTSTGVINVGNLVSTAPSRFSTIRPELLPTMQVLQSIDTEALITARMQKLIAIWMSHDPPNAARYDVEHLEFDPIRINQELNAYFELLVRDRVNQAARAITLAFSVGSDLDAIASRYPAGGVPRKTATATDPALLWTGPGTQEPDAIYKQRVWLAPNILSLAGPGQSVNESYVYWAMAAPMPVGELPIKHATIYTKPYTGNVFMPILPYQPLNTTWTQSIRDLNTWTLTPNAVVYPTAKQIAAVYQYVTANYQGRMGLTDVLSVLKPKVINTTIDADIYLFPGVDPITLMADITKAVGDLIVALNWLGADLTLLALEGAFAQAGVYNTKIRSPAADTLAGLDTVVNIQSASLTYKGVGE
jgi:phage-related baseplate assembly protein